ncbi:glycosyltransferase family 39 protein, partial [Patescibacteria group bacterium]|nr:glycosyltransferase family 39 protein [Patescibacteria group bacterium]
MGITPSKKLWLYLSIFIILNILLYLFIFLFNSKIPFSKFDYTKNAHHYLADPRIKGGEFNFLRAMGQYDAQWYLKIAEEGYPKNPTITDMNNKRTLDGITYAFFPLYPLILSFVNFPIKNIELTAFITSNLIMLAIFFSLYIIIKNLYDENKALKTIFLLFFFPFAIFYRSYFTEGLFLLLLIWFAYFLIKKQWLRTAFFLSLLFVTKPIGAFFGLLFLFFIINSYRHKRINMRLLIYSLTVSILPFLGWLAYCYINTGIPIYWMTAYSNWKIPSFPIS